MDLVKIYKIIETGKVSTKNGVFGLLAPFLEGYRNIETFETDYPYLQQFQKMALNFFKRNLLKVNSLSKTFKW